MKKIIISLFAAFICVASFAQSQRSDFQQRWFIGTQVGGSHMSGEKFNKNYFNLDGDIYLGWHITPVFSLRGDISGLFKVKNSAPSIDKDYFFFYHQTSIDAMFDILNIFRYKDYRAVNPYLFVGTGRSFRYRNDQALAMPDQFSADYLWDDPVYNVFTRVGFGLEIKTSENFALTLEIQNNMHEESFNSKKDDAFLGVDHLHSALLGVKFYLGKSKASSKNDEAIAEAEAARAEAEAKAAAAKAAEEEAARIAAEEAAAREAARIAAEEAAAREAARAAARAYTATVTFTINKWDINESQLPILAKVISVMNQYPEAYVDLQGYADKDTGTHEINMDLSEKRARTVAQYLIDNGIAASRVSFEFFGDTKSISTHREGNRAVLILVK